MNSDIHSTKPFAIKSYKKAMIVGASVLLGAIVAISLVVFFIYNSQPKVAYQPSKACDLLTFTKARDLMGNKTIPSITKSPVVSGNTAISHCGYTNGNPDTNNIIVAAVMVRSGINDRGVQQNKTDFASSKPTQNTEPVKNIGETAYFNHALGQLNILDKHDWLIVSYGLGEAPEANTVDQAIELGRILLR